MGFVDYIFTNAEAILGIIIAAHALALTIVNLTPTPKDNEALAKAYRGVEFLAGLITRKAKL